MADGAHAKGHFDRPPHLLPILFEDGIPITCGIRHKN